MFGQSQVQASGRSEDDAVGNSLSVFGARRGYQEFTKMAQGNSLEEDRDSLEDYQGKSKSLPEVGKFLKWICSDDIVGARREFARSSSKESGSLLRTHREITRGRS
ncbi:hypothetical protein BHE74_00051612 [Ensete ventricosum]|nr:hypothetical protein BHE74_00051612 [Ensete ventricosum]